MKTHRANQHLHGSNEWLKNYLRKSFLGLPFGIVSSFCVCVCCKKASLVLRFVDLIYETFHILALLQLYDTFSYSSLLFHASFMNKIIHFTYFFCSFLSEGLSSEWGKRKLRHGLLLLSWLHVLHRRRRLRRCRCCICVVCLFPIPDRRRRCRLSVSVARHKQASKKKRSVCAFYCAGTRRRGNCCAKKK